MPRSWTVIPLLAAAVGPAWGKALPVRGEAAVRSELARRPTVSIVAELARPEGGEPASADVAAARERLGRALDADVRGLGDLPFVVLEVDAARLAALLATGEVVSVAPQGTASID